MSRQSCQEGEVVSKKREVDRIELYFIDKNNRIRKDREAGAPRRIPGFLA